MSETEWRQRLARTRRADVGLGVLGSSMVLLFLLPVLALIVAAVRQPVLIQLRDPFVVRAIWVSASSSVCTILLTLFFATPLAFQVARSEGRLVRAIEVLALMPLVLPPAVAGLGLLLALGRTGLLATLLPFPSIALTWSALVVAQVFVAAPFYFWAALAAFRQLDPELMLVLRAAAVPPTRTLIQVVVPLAWRPLLAGAVLCWGRAVGEFGATLVFAGSIEGVTQTMPMAIYAATESDLGKAGTLSVLMLICAALIIALALRLGQTHRPTPHRDVARRGADRGAAPR